MDAYDEVMMVLVEIGAFAKTQQMNEIEYLVKEAASIAINENRLGALLSVESTEIRTERREQGIRKIPSQVRKFSP